MLRPGKKVPSGSCPIRTRDVALLSAVIPCPAQYAVNSDPVSFVLPTLYRPTNPSSDGWHQIPPARTGPRSARREPDGAVCSGGESRRRGVQAPMESGGLTGGADLAKLGHFGHVRPVRLRLPRHADRSAVWGNER